MTGTNLLVLGALLLLAASACSLAAEAQVFTGENVRLELNSDDGTHFKGTIVAAGMKMPFTATRAQDRLTGTFESDGEKFAFTADLTGDQLVFVTEDQRYTLKKEGGRQNPLARKPQASGVEPGKADAREAEPAKPEAKTTDPAAPTDKRKAEKDPLAYRILELPAGKVAKFDNWTYTPIMGDANVAYCDSFPNGRQSDFIMRAYVGTPNAQDMANLFTVGPVYAQQLLASLFGPAFKQAEPPKKCTSGGDEAMVESYAGEVMGKKLTCQVMYVKRKDIAIAVMGIGTDAGLKEFGRAIEIVAQSISLKESAIEPGLVGTWTSETFASANSGITPDTKINVASSRSLTIYPNSTFSDTAQTGVSGQDVTGLAQGGSRGAVIKRGNVLTFKYDDGKTWSATYQLFSNGLKLDGKVYLKN